MTVGKTPSWLASYLQPDEIEKISEAIKQAEGKTVGEIVPIIVRRSTNTGHIPLVLSLLLFSCFLLFEKHSDTYDWDDYFWYLTPAAFLMFFLLSLWLSKYSFIQRLLTTKSDQINDVHLRAEVEFYRGRLHATERRSAILIFISLMEHRVVVWGDQLIAEKLPQSTWDELVRTLVGQIRDGRLGAGLIASIDKCGKILAQHFPVTASDRNEIPNQLIIKE